jgi:hypothetical protein
MAHAGPAEYLGGRFGRGDVLPLRVRWAPQPIAQRSNVLLACEFALPSPRVFRVEGVHDGRPGDVLSAAGTRSRRAPRQFRPHSRGRIAPSLLLALVVQMIPPAVGFTRVVLQVRAPRVRLVSWPGPDWIGLQKHVTRHLGSRVSISRRRSRHVCAAPGAIVTRSRI